jgi:D-lactate dehydrogenase
MKIALFSVQPAEKIYLEQANQHFNYELIYHESHLNTQIATLAQGFTVVSCFVADNLDVKVIELLAKGGTRCIALRCAGFNNVDLNAAKKYGICITRVPAYSPYAVAEFAVGLILSLNRKIHRAYWRVRDNNFSLNGLLGFDLHGKTVGVIGTGKIGEVFCKIMQGFGCQLLGYDPYPNERCRQYGLRYTSLAELYEQSDIISLHCPLTPESHHIINATALKQMKPSVMLINTGRGGLLDTKAVINALKGGKIGYLGLDVYEEEESLFFQDRSLQILQDDVFARLETFPNVMITGHQAYFTQEALLHIAMTTFENIQNFLQGNAANQIVST